MSDPAAFSGRARDTHHTPSAGAATDEHLELDQAQTDRFITSAEGAVAGEPQAWVGKHSGVQFSAEWNGEVPILVLHIDAEIPLQFKEAMKNEDALVSYAELLDFACEVASDTTVGKAAIQEQLVGLVYIRDFFGRSHEELTQALEDTGKKMDPTSENRQQYRKSLRSIAAVGRLASRLESRIAEVADPRLLAALAAEDDTLISH